MYRVEVNARDGGEMKGESGQEEGCLHFGEVKGASGVIDDCEMLVEVGLGAGRRRGRKQQKGCWVGSGAHLNVKVALHFSVK
jgi:hypothetical protein